MKGPVARIQEGLAGDSQVESQLPTEHHSLTSTKSLTFLLSQYSLSFIDSESVLCDRTRSGTTERGF